MPGLKKLVETVIAFLVAGVMILLGGKAHEIYETSKLRSEALKLDRITSGVIKFWGEYGSLPGDGCNTLAEASGICKGPKNGLLENASAEPAAAWSQLVEFTHTVKRSDQSSNFGFDWVFWTAHDTGGSPVCIQCEDATCLTSTEANPLPLKSACILDKLHDDGYSLKGVFRAGESGCNSFTQIYTPDTDCDDLDGKVQVFVRIFK